MGSAAIPDINDLDKRFIAPIPNMTQLIQSDSFAALKNLINDTARFVGLPFMRAAVESLSRTLGADFAFISRTVHGVPGTVQMIAAHRDGQVTEGWTFHLCGTPCDLIYQERPEDPWLSMKVGRSVAINKQVCELFDATRGTRFQSFIGVPLFDGESRMVGHVALFFNQAVADDQSLKLTVELVELFAQKIQAELNRMIADQSRDNLLGDLRRLVEQLEHESITCGLTGLYNRRYFSRRMAQRQMSSAAVSPYALLLIDIDYFKRINDTYGHDVGDEVLGYVCRTIQQGIRGSAEEVYRLGGDELAVVVTGEIRLCDLQRLGERLSRAVTSGWKPLCAGLMPPTLSIGASRRSDSDRDWENIYVRADRALYASKRNGRNCTTVQEADFEVAL